MSHSDIRKPIFILIFASILALGFCLITFNPKLWELRRVQDALSVYFSYYHKYPKDLETLVRESYLKERSFPHISYIPGIGYGIYKIAYEGSFICSMTGPPPSEISDYEVLKNFRIIHLKEYYSRHGHYPEVLDENITNDKSIYLDQVLKRKIPYLAYNNLQNFTLNGSSFGPPSTWPSETKLLTTEEKIQILERALNDFHVYNNRYPHTLKELADRGGTFAEKLKDLTEGENIFYEVSEDGKAASLNGWQVKQIIGTKGGISKNQSQEKNLLFPP